MPEGSFSTTALGPPWIEAITAFITKAANWPVTIISWSTATRLPRCSLGADSERYTGTVVEAPPTASPRTKRAMYISQMFGARAQPTAPTKNTAASSRMLWRRP